MFPELDSMIVVPGAMSPSSRASVSIRSAGRSLMLPPGLAASSFAQTRIPASSR